MPPAFLSFFIFFDLSDFYNSERGRTCIFAVEMYGKCDQTFEGEYLRSMPKENKIAGKLIEAKAGKGRIFSYKESQILPF
jgi:hypothetical protein